MLRPISDDHATGSSLKGYLTAQYKELVAKFGAPNSEGDGCKVQAEWILEADDGTLVTIYDWKEYGRDVKTVTDWHIGGIRPQAVDVIAKEFPNNLVRPWR